MKSTKHLFAKPLQLNLCSTLHFVAVAQNAPLNSANRWKLCNWLQRDWPILAREDYPKGKPCNKAEMKIAEDVMDTFVNLVHKYAQNPWNRLKMDWFHENIEELCTEYNSFMTGDKEWSSNFLRDYEKFTEAGIVGDQNFCQVTGYVTAKYYRSKLGKMEKTGVSPDSLKFKNAEAYFYSNAKIVERPGESEDGSELEEAA